ncbi:MAG: hypothetical protein LDL12_08095 [Anaerolinea sp.]|nr:hypothetical protein [Anaerolinea sp.]
MILPRMGANEKAAVQASECGKIEIRMESFDAATCASPRVMDSFVAGFNLVSNRIYLIAMPAGLDVLLWLGPRLSVSKLLERRFEDWLAAVSDSLSPAALNSLTIFQQLVLDYARQQNLLSLLSTLPVGLPSMLAWKGGRQTPWGMAREVQLASEGGVVAAWVGCLLVGLLAGCVYFALLAHFTSPHSLRWNWLRFARQCGQALVLMGVLMGLVVVGGVPTLLLLMLAASLSVEAAGLLMLALGAAAIFVLLPLVFTVHGVFAFGLAALDALYSSMLLVRRCLPGVGLFVLVAVLLAQGLDMLWKSSAPDSWLLLMGIGARAFIYTAILAASFIYYRSGAAWLALQSRPRWGAMQF